MNVNEIKIGDTLGFIPKYKDEDDEAIYWYHVTDITDKIIHLDGFKLCYIEKRKLQDSFADKVAFIANTEQEKLFYELKIK